MTSLCPATLKVGGGSGRLTEVCLKFLTLDESGLTQDLAQPPKMHLCIMPSANVVVRNLATQLLEIAVGSHWEQGQMTNVCSVSVFIESTLARHTLSKEYQQRPQKT